MEPEWCAVTNYLNTHEKKEQVALVIVIILVVGVILFDSIKNNGSQVDQQKNNVENYSDLGLKFHASYLENCYLQLNYSADEISKLGESACFEKNLPSKEDVENLKTIQNIQGIKVCSNPVTNCSFDESNASSCEIKLNLTYQRVITIPVRYEIYVFQCSNEDYILKKYQAPIGVYQKIEMYRIRPDDRALIEGFKQ